MIESEFNRIVSEQLHDSWGLKAYPPAVVNKLWRMVREINAGDFRSALDTLSMTVTRAPALGQIRAACMPAIARGLEDKRREQVKKLDAAGCTMCGGSGWVAAVLRNDPMIEFAFICNCPASSAHGITTSRGARYWAPEFEESGEYVVRRHTLAAAKEIRSLEESTWLQTFMRTGEVPGIVSLSSPRTTSEPSERCSDLGEAT